MSKWVKTNFKGVRYREHPTRKHGIQKDRYFVLRYKLNGKDHEEALGWASEGMTAQKAALRLAEIRENQKKGEGPFTLKEKRETELAKRKAEETARLEQERASIPFSEIWKQYIEQCRADGKKSIDREQSFYTHWISKVIGNKPLAEIAPIHLQKLKSEMTKGGNSPRSIHYCLAVVRQVFNFAIKHDLFKGDNPVSKVDKPTSDNRRMRFLTFEEAEQLLEALKLRSLDCWRLTLISLQCGLRFSELAGLTWGDVDMERNTLYVRDTKNTKSRFAPMTDHVREALLEMDPGGKSELIFPARNGGERTQQSDTFDRVVMALRFNEGITDSRQKVCFHTCRHTYASWLVEGGTDLFVVKELLGHKTLAMTERYSHLRPDTLQAAAKNLGNRVTEAKPDKGEEDSGKPNLALVR